MENTNTVFDVIVVGAGIAGASTALFLKEAGLSVLVLEKNSICSGGSYPAGAFLSPKISKPSAYKTYLNDAFLFSTNFYKERFPALFNRCGLEKIPLDKKDIKRCQSYEPFIEFTFSKSGNNYFFPDAGIINPIKLCQALLKDIEVKENYEVTEIVYDSFYQIGNFQAKNLILATGSDKLPFNLPYLKTKNIAGYRYDVTFDDYEKQIHNMHKNLSISSYHESIVAIGATHIKESEVTNLEEQANEDAYGLLTKAQSLLPMQNLKVLKTYTGYRNSTFDYFPIVGKLIDQEETLKIYPSIAKGTKIATKNYSYLPNLYIHSALGSRGFVYAPYNAKILAELILNNKEIDERLSPVRLFKKWAVKV